MTCREFETVAPALARLEILDSELDFRARQHLGECPVCSEVLRAQRYLNSILRAVTLEDAPMQAPPAVRTRLRDDLRSARPARVNNLVFAGWAVAASLAVWAVLSVSGPITRPSVGDTAQTLYGAIPFTAIPFTAIPTSGRWEPSAGGRIMRVHLPADAPALFGLPVPSNAQLERIEADVLLGNDGTAHAIRFLPGSFFPRALNK